MAREKVPCIFESLHCILIYMSGGWKKLLVVELKVISIDSLILVPEKLSQLDRIHTFPSP